MCPLKRKQERKFKNPALIPPSLFCPCTHYWVFILNFKSEVWVYEQHRLERTGNVITYNYVFIILYLDNTKGIFAYLYKLLNENKTIYDQSKNSIIMNPCSFAISACLCFTRIIYWSKLYFWITSFYLSNPWYAHGKIEFFVYIFYKNMLCNERPKINDW